ncbi:PPOX class F420-dependent oxidoreductase [Amycolatopsis samaneae]|uniref:PPOX class F420-dependent oxidoreductase n=1 Tax=Amycolatopsis samaneae TaxID=664691 RepID=A0ABW5GRQ5_9PSEU
MFTEKEIAYLRTQRLGRLATVGAHGEPHNVPVGLHYNAELGTIDIGGLNMAASRKYRDIRRNALVSFVVDDVDPIDPWTPRGIEVRGTAEALAEGGRRFNDVVADEMIRITPGRVVSWGIEAPWQDGTHARGTVPRPTPARGEK